MLDKILENIKNNKNIECFEINDVIYTYGELYQYICNIYEYIITNNTAKTPVIVYGHKSIYMLATFLACSFAGIPYVPLDKSIPEKRKEEIIKEINPKIIIDESIENIMKKQYYKDINEILMKDNDIYYIIYTSGSTGKPKGGMITYKNLKSCLNWLMDICKLENGTILNQANFSFDLSVADIYLSLLTKSKHFIIDRDTQKDYSVLFKRLNKSNANLAVMTPSFAELLLIDKTFNKNLMLNLNKILFCGDRLSNKTVQKLYERFDNIKIINSYGPTECTFAVTSINIDKNYINEELPIGYPKKDVEIIIVDDELEKVKDGVDGEILILGESVSNGYVDKNLNKNKFIKYNHKNAYCTGDIGYIKDGKLYYKCRKDKQIKYKGYRIELADIENTISKLSYIEKVVVSALKENSDKVSKILAFVKLKYSISVEKIKEDISSFLPDYMCPNIKIVNNFPLNQNGKCDEKKLIEEYLNGTKNS